MALATERDLFATTFSVFGSRKESFHMVAELVDLRASRSHRRDATDESNAAAADGGNPTAAGADAAAATSASADAAGPAATRFTPNSNGRNGETVSASAVKHERVR